MEPKNTTNDQDELSQQKPMRHELTMAPLPSSIPSPEPAPAASVPVSIAVSQDAPVQALPLPVQPSEPSMAAPITPVEPVAPAPAIPGPVELPTSQPQQFIPTATPLTDMSQSVFPTNPGITVGSDVAANTPVASNTSKKSFIKPLLIVLVALTVIGGGSAAAYVGVIVPNKPENVLKAALINTAQEKQGTYEGIIEGGPAIGAGLAYKSTFSGSVDTVAKSAETKFTVTYSGVSLPIEAKYVSKNAYVKVGDLTTIANLASTLDPGLGKSVQTLNKEVANKWIVIDSTLIDTAGASCVLDTNFSLTKADIQLLEMEYAKHPFTTIESSSKDTIKGKAVQKFELSIDDDAAAVYGNNLNGLSFVKALEKCPGVKDSSDSASKAKGDHDKTPLTLWVDKSTKRIVQVAGKSTEQDAKKDNLKLTFNLALNYNKVSIKAPDGAIPAADIIAKFLATPDGAAYCQLFGGSSSLANPNSTTVKPLSTTIKPNTKPVDLPLLQNQLRSLIKP